MTPPNQATSVHELFSDQARATPDAVAVVHDSVRVTYAELNARANRLAARLLTEGVVPQARVGMLVERSVDAVVAMLAILKAGGAYVPLEPTYPRSRLAFMVEDAGLAHVVVHARLRDRIGDDVRAVLVDDHPGSAPAETWRDVAVSADHLAYVMYTSGSSGSPKGVEVVHRAIGRLVRGVDYVRLGPSAVLLHAAPLAFDASTFEIWAALLNGGRVVIYPDAVPTARGLRDVIARHGITTMWLTAALFNAIVDDEPGALGGVAELVIGGEALSVSHVRRALEALPTTTIINGYGPTETTTFAATYTIPRTVDPLARSIPIGRPIGDTKLHVLDPERTPVASGEIGELYIGGSGLARGYLARPELTAEKFVPNPFVAGERLYRTGDLVRALVDGTIDYVGRIDGQVKIRGFRVELGEIEIALMRHPDVARAVVVARDGAGGKRLIAYVVARGDVPRASELRDLLRTTLPDCMVPSAFVGLAAVPITTNGKIDHRALPSPPNERPDLSREYVAPESDREQTLCLTFAEVLGVAPVGALDNFFELGGNSLLAMRAVTALRAHGIDLPVLALFEHPTARALAGFVESRASDGRSPQDPSPGRGVASPVAIVGMAGRFPGARNVAELWQVLHEGRETVRFFRDDELHASVPASVREGADYVKARGILEDVDKLDAGFFGIPPNEAALMDPQQRVMLEVAWEALESAGHIPSTFAGPIGVFAGKYNDSYHSENVVTRPDLVEALGSFQAMLGHEKDYVASRIAHKLDLTGPAISVHTACSTSLVAIAQAVRSLRAGECDLALAGGVAITVPVNSGHTYQEGAMLSNDGHTRSFDEGARGTVFSDGAGMVVLRRLEDAVRDGDTIHAVIRGVAVNNDGRDKASFTAPSSEGQAKVIAMAHADAGVDARSISYVEAHGTATPLGDPIEIDALTRAFRRHTGDSGFCAVGSIKSNLGHTVVAAGVAGVIKTALALSNEVIPQVVHFRAPNPQIDFARSPFFVNAQALPWPRTSTPRRAGVSSFGVGGTNAHAVLEEAPLRESDTPRRDRQLLLLSARSPAALDAQARALGEYLKEHSQACLADVAFTLHRGRRDFPHRRTLVAEDAQEASKTLLGEGKTGGRVRDREPKVVFMFPGQGAQYVGMGRALYRDEPMFRREVDRCAELLRAHDPQGTDLRALMFPADGDAEAAAASLRETRHTQPALFTLEYALAMLWRSWGVRPTAMVGHSVGELVCAVMTEVMGLEDALRLVTARARLMFDVPRGSMLSVRLPAREMEARLGLTLTDRREWDVSVPSARRLSVASDNGPSLCVIAGPTCDIEALKDTLTHQGIVHRDLQTSHAFHSSMMDPVVEPFTAIVRTVALSAPRIPFVSTLTGTWITSEQACDPSYWGKHLRQTVRFAAGIATLWKEQDTLLLEVGPRSTLTTLARQQITDRSVQKAIPSLADTEGDDESGALLEAMGQLWLAGVPIDGRAYWGDERRSRIPLPTYPFERQRHWIESDVSAAVVPPPPAQEKTPVTVAQQTSPDVPRLLNELRTIFEDASGIEISADAAGVSFLELGFDSLFLTQVAIAVQKKLSVKITFRQLLEDFPNLQALAEHLGSVCPPEKPRADGPPATVAREATPAPAAPAAGLERVIEEQLRLMTTQLAMLRGGGSEPVPVTRPEVQEPAPPIASKPFGAIARISVNAAEAMTPRQRARLEAFTRRYSARTKASKQWTQDNRAHMADPRVVTGFRPAMKELVYPIVVERSAGARLWDLDGNEYVDTLNGFGSNLFGWQPEFVTRAIEHQLRTGHEIGPQSPLAGECAKLVCELTGFDRAAFCNTGSEAVMGTMRIARTVTGRSKIALFTGSYHGIFDEVIVRGTKRLRSIPAAPGIMKETSENVLVLDYATPESLEILKAQAGDLAAILVEPVQSRRPELQPRAFLHELRSLTEKSGTVLIFDEVITGFRTCPGGAQEHFGVRVDLASYGKVIGGGLPVGVIAGKRAFMDALDGGHWEFGDASVPTVGVTYFAGTFVRHPLALAAVKAVLLHLKAMGPRVQQETTAKTERLAGELNAFFAEAGVPLEIRRFASLWRTFFAVDQPWSDLLFCMLRDRGVHIMDGFPCFFTTAHTEADVDFIVTQMKAAVTEMQEGGFFPERASKKKTARSFDTSTPPILGARVGRDPSGDLAWFVPNPKETGKYMKVEEPS